MSKGEAQMEVAYFSVLKVAGERVSFMSPGERFDVLAAREPGDEMTVLGSLIGIEVPTLAVVLDVAIEKHLNDPWTCALGIYLPDSEQIHYVSIEREIPEP